MSLRISVPALTTQHGARITTALVCPCLGAGLGYEVLRTPFWIVSLLLALL